MQRIIGILGTGYYVPDQVLANEALGARVGVAESWIVAKTGVRERRIASPDQATSDLAAEAARRALDAAGLTAADLDLIVVATSTPDWMQPATACAVQGLLGAHRAAAFDMNAVCTGFVYALNVVSGLMAGNPAISRALVIGAETYSRFLDYEDPRTCVLFGDGAGAAVLGPVPSGYGVMSSCLGSDGTKTDWVQVPAGGSRLPASPETVAARDHFFHMDGRAVRTFLKEQFAATVRSAVESAGLTLDDVDMLISHQANGVLLHECLADLGIPASRFHTTFERYGNTGAASVAITLADAIHAGRVDHGSCVLLVAFGGGMTWGGTVIRWTGAPQLAGARTHAAGGVR